MQNVGRQTFETLRAEIEHLEATHPDRAIVLIETPPNVGVSSMSRTPQVRKSFLQSLSLHADGTIWFNAVPRARGSAGLWDASTMRIVVSDLPRAELRGIVPEWVQVTDV
ncbi:hypothetical protein C0Q88_25310 [Ralstonia pickettii]|uniref:Uncharacterized protein n=1 Tax=Ralstonia pickettii TaxID=329 RepID=A0A2N4TJZ4_RALPI|nr:hypothetical protein [Ralstonia pickettii]PLC40015.1 hypothetical protein C0Q88_25310 [Ralstonia pickettii]